MALCLQYTYFLLPPRQNLHIPSHSKTTIMNSEQCIQTQRDQTDNLPEPNHFWCCHALGPCTKTQKDPVEPPPVANQLLIQLCTWTLHSKTTNRSLSWTKPPSQAIRHSDPAFRLRENQHPFFPIRKDCPPSEPTSSSAHNQMSHPDHDSRPRDNKHPSLPIPKDHPPSHQNPHHLLQSNNKIQLLYAPRQWRYVNVH